MNERAARLSGALETQRKAIRYAFSPIVIAAKDEIRQQLQASIGPETYAALFREGSMLSLEDALSLGESE